MLYINIGKSIFNIDESNIRNSLLTSDKEINNNRDFNNNSNLIINNEQNINQDFYTNQYFIHNTLLKSNNLNYNIENYFTNYTTTLDIVNSIKNNNINHIVDYKNNYNNSSMNFYKQNSIIGRLSCITTCTPFGINMKSIKIAPLTILNNVSIPNKVKIYPFSREITKERGLIIDQEKWTNMFINWKKYHFIQQFYIFLSKNDVEHNLWLTLSYFLNIISDINKELVKILYHIFPNISYRQTNIEECIDPEIFFIPLIIFLQNIYFLSIMNTNLHSITNLCSYFHQEDSPVFKIMKQNELLQDVNSQVLLVGNVEINNFFSWILHSYSVSDLNLNKDIDLYLIKEDILLFNHLQNNCQILKSNKLIIQNKELYVKLRCKGTLHNINIHNTYQSYYITIGFVKLKNDYIEYLRIYQSKTHGDHFEIKFNCCIPLHPIHNKVIKILIWKRDELESRLQNEGENPIELDSSKSIKSNKDIITFSTDILTPSMNDKILFRKKISNPDIRGNITIAISCKMNTTNCTMGENGVKYQHNNNHVEDNTNTNQVRACTNVGQAVDDPNRPDDTNQIIDNNKSSDLHLDLCGCL